MKPLSALKLPAARFDNESGIALAEVLTAAIVIVLILTANAYGLLAAYAAYGTAESTSKAYQIINTQFAYFKQAPWPQLGTVRLNQQIDSARLGAGRGCGSELDFTTARAANFENVSALARTSAYKYTGDANEVPFQFCQAVQYPSQAKPVVLYNVTGGEKTGSDGKPVGGLGTTYYYQTVITNVTTNTYDGSNPSSTANATTYYNPKRITVTVSWQENDSSGKTQTQTVTLSTVRSPSLAECAPSSVRTGTGLTIAAQGCGVG